MAWLPDDCYNQVIMGRGCRLGLLSIVSLGTLVVLSSVAGASSANISHAYKTSGSLSNGSLVSLDPQKSGYVVPANENNGSRLLGIAVAGNDSLIAIGAQSGSVQVATAGNANALVSTVDGNIDVGDQIGVSPFNGVGMKALPGSKVIGLAQTAFDSHTPGATNETVKTKTGQSTSVKVGYIRLNISIANNASGAGGQSLNSLQKVAQSITGRTVPTSRVVISLAVAVIALLALITLVYASIYGSIVSIGRNPLAKYAVFRTLGLVLGLALLTTSISGVTIFFLLK